MAQTSGPRRTRDAQRARTRTDLLAAAAQVFARHGYHATSVDMVAEAAGYTKGAVYSNFDSKEELFLALLEGRHEESMASVQDLMDTSEPQDRPEAFARRRGEISTWEPEWFLLEAEFELYAARNPSVRALVSERQQRTLENVKTAIERHIRELELEPAYDIDSLARIIVAAGDGVSLMALNNPDTTDQGKLMRILLEVLGRGATTGD